MNDVIDLAGGFALGLLAILPFIRCDLLEHRRRARGLPPNRWWWRPALPFSLPIALIALALGLWREAGGALFRDAATPREHIIWILFALVVTAGLLWEWIRLLKRMLRADQRHDHDADPSTHP
jgi:hypothetical protein